MLTTCRECKGQVALGAKSCPHCGAKKPGRGGFLHGMHQTSNFILYTGLVFLVLGMLVMCG